MEKEFIPYEQALALKELGFDEACLGYYTGDKMHFVLRPLMLRVNELESYVVTAPLYQQVFRWFREKYDMASFIQRFEGDVFDYEINSDIFKEVTDFGDGYFDTYEEAELECLRKLIEIVKNKKQKS